MSDFDAEAMAWIAGFPGATATRIAHLARLGLRVEAAAERDGPEREELAKWRFYSWLGEGQFTDHWSAVAAWYGWHDEREASLEWADDFLASDWLRARDQRVREECAKVAEEHGRTWGLGYVTMTDTIAAAIRGDAK